MIVVDTNVLASLLLPAEATDSVERLLLRDSEWLAPLLWKSELRNVLATAVRTGAVELEHGLEVMNAAEALMEGRELAVESDLVLRLAAESGCTAYDCEFVALARELGVKLYTLDGKVLERFPEEAKKP